MRVTLLSLEAECLGAAMEDAPWVRSADDVVALADPALRRLCRRGSPAAAVRAIERLLGEAARREPVARFVALVDHRRNGPLAWGLVRGWIAPRAVRLSRERRRQVVKKALLRWASKRFPRLVGTLNDQRRACWLRSYSRCWSAPPEQAWQPPPVVPAPQMDLAPVPAPAPDPEWLATLSSLRLVPTDDDAPSAWLPDGLAKYVERGRQLRRPHGHP